MELGTKLVAFGPKTDPSAGPFVLERVNAGKALLVRNEHFDDRPRSPAKVKLRNYATIRPSGTCRSPGTLTPPPTLPPHQRRAADPRQRAATGGSPDCPGERGADVQPELPAASIRRRYAVPSRTLSIGPWTADRTAGERRARRIPAGLVADAARAWLGKDGVNQLNPYPVDRGRSAALLAEAGLTRVDGQWRVPGGKPFAFTIQVPAPYSDWVAAARSIAGQLTDFGIAVEVRTSADFAAYQAEMAAGKYPVGFWLIGLGPSTYNAYARLYGAANGWSVFGGRLTHSPPNTAGNWIGSPKSAVVPGLGRVNPGEATFRLSQLPIAEQKATVAQWRASPTISSRCCSCGTTSTCSSSTTPGSPAIRRMTANAWV